MVRRWGRRALDSQQPLALHLSSVRSMVSETAGGLPVHQAARCWQPGVKVPLVGAESKPSGVDTVYGASTNQSARLNTVAVGSLSDVDATPEFDL